MRPGTQDLVNSAQIVHPNLVPMVALSWRKFYDTADLQCECIGRTSLDLWTGQHRSIRAITTCPVTRNRGPRHPMILHSKLAADIKASQLILWLHFVMNWLVGVGGVLQDKKQG